MVLAKDARRNGATAALAGAPDRAPFAGGVVRPSSAARIKKIVADEHERPRGFVRLPKGRPATPDFRVHVTLGINTEPAFCRSDH
jgi:hypothetical protein